MLKQGKDISALDFVIDELSVPNTLPETYRDHGLKGDFADYRECHIESDWLLIYGYETLEDGESQLLLVRTGSHSELFE
jgi:mRNA interferase YafQ